MSKRTRIKMREWNKECCFHTPSLWRTIAVFFRLMHYSHTHRYKNEEIKLSRVICIRYDVIDSKSIALFSFFFLFLFFYRKREQKRFANDSKPLFNHSKLSDTLHVILYDTCIRTPRQPREKRLKFINIHGSKLRFFA